MCKYCETDTWENISKFWMGEVICDNTYEDCKIVHTDDDYYIYLIGS